jgi:putative membrane protein
MKGKYSMNWLRNFITGFLIGLANLIPGVSGGTFALILGVYERLIHFLNRFGTSTLRELFPLVKGWIASGFSAGKRKELFSYLKENDYHFMTTLLLGTVSCILVMSSLMKFLLLNYFTYTYAYFFGLIILSVIVPWRMLKTPRGPLIIPALAGIILTVGVTAAVNPYDKALNKSKILEKKYMEQTITTMQEAEKAKSTKFAYIQKYSTGEYIYIFFCGTIAISAMVLPGISGSLVLILLNQYFTVISAVANIRALLLDDLLFLSCMMAGITFGLLSFARVIDFAFRRFHDRMVAFLIGLIVGSLYSLWPFKEAHVIPEFYIKEGNAVEKIANHTVYSNANILPPDTTTLLLATAAVVAGLITMFIFVRTDTAITGSEN